MIVQPKVASNELRALLQKTNKEKPSQADRQALEAYIEEHGIAELATVGNLARLISDAIIKKAFGHDYGFALTVEAKSVELRDELGYKQAPPLEKMLIQHIVTVWLRLHICEFRYELISGECTLEQALFWEKTLSAHQRRYLRAVETLAKVRRLGVNVQINVANQQVITR